MTPRSADGATRAAPPVIDARGLKCPWPVLRAARAMRETGEIVLLTDDPVARIDVPALAHSNGWTLIQTDEQDHSSFHLRDTAR